MKLILMSIRGETLSLVPSAMLTPEPAPLMGRVYRVNPNLLWERSWAGKDAPSDWLFSHSRVVEARRSPWAPMTFSPSHIWQLLQKGCQGEQDAMGVNPQRGTCFIRGTRMGSTDPIIRVEGSKLIFSHPLFGEIEQFDYMTFAVVTAAVKV